MAVKLYIEGYIGEADPFDEMFFGESQSFGAKNMKDFLDANKSEDEIEIEIRSGGGSVDVGIDIYEQLRNSGKKITTVAYECASIATVIFLAGDVRKVTKYAAPLIHNPWIDGWSLGGMNADQLASLSDELRMYENRILDIYVERTQADRNELSSIMSKDKPMSSEDFKRLGFATEIINGEKAKAHKALAFIKAHKNQNMDNKKEIMSWFERIESAIKNLMPKSVKNLTTKLVDGTTTLYFKTDAEAFAVGDEVYLDEAFTMPAPVGEHELETGEKIVLKVDDAGIATIESITPAGDENKDEEMAAMKAENDRLKSELEAAQNEATALKNSVAELETKVNNFNAAKAKADENVKAVKKELEDLKAMVLDAEDKTPPPTPSKAQQDLEQRRRMRG